MSLPTEMIRPAAGARERLQLELLGGEVDAGEQELPDRRDGRPVPDETGLLDRLVEELLEQAEAAVDADVVRRAQRAACERAHVAIRPDEREVRLRVAAVHGEHDRQPDGHRPLGGEQALDEPR